MTADVGAHAHDGSAVGGDSSRGPVEGFCTAIVRVVEELVAF